MEIDYSESQDITLRLRREETELLFSNGLTENFQDVHSISQGLLDSKYYTLLKGVSKKLNAYFLLGKSRTLLKEMTTEKVMDLDGQMGEMWIPEPEEKGNPWLINLSIRGLDHFRTGWQFGIRYDGEHKLFIARLE